MSNNAASHHMDSLEKMTQLIESFFVGKSVEIRLDERRSDYIRFMFTHKNQPYFLAISMGSRGAAILIYTMFMEVTKDTNPDIYRHFCERNCGLDMVRFYLAPTTIQLGFRFDTTFLPPTQELILAAITDLFYHFARESEFYLQTFEQPAMVVN